MLVRMYTFDGDAQRRRLNVFRVRDSSKNRPLLAVLARL